MEKRLREIEREYFATGDIELLPLIHRLRERLDIIPTNSISRDHFSAIMRGKTEVNIDEEYVKIFSPFKNKFIEPRDIAMSSILNQYKERMGWNPLNFDVFRLEPGFGDLIFGDLIPAEFDELLREIAQFMKRFGWVTLIREPSYEGEEDFEIPPDDFDEQYSEALIFPITALQPNGKFEHRSGEVIANEAKWGEANEENPEMIFLVQKSYDSGYLTHNCKYMEEQGRISCAAGKYGGSDFKNTLEDAYINYLQRLIPIGWMRGLWDFQLIWS